MNDFDLVDKRGYFEEYQNMNSPPAPQQSTEVIAATFAALGQSSRLRIVRLLLSAYPKGLPAGEIQRELAIAAPTLSHHLDKLRQVNIVRTDKERQWIWYSVNSETLKSIMDFLYEECCTRNQVVGVDAFSAASAPDSTQDAECCG